ncbi:MAG: hypothetical protein K2H04_03845, partial [Bacteroidaceae bacterium]|nr:hypothetical protein [Bacteroidaceae bacterium]
SDTESSPSANTPQKLPQNRSRGHRSVGVRGHRPTDVPDSDFEALTAPVEQDMIMPIIRSSA